MSRFTGSRVINCYERIASWAGTKFRSRASHITGSCNDCSFQVMIPEVIYGNYGNTSLLKILIINVNRFSHVDNLFIKKYRPLVPLDLNFMLDSHSFSLQATIDHHGFPIYSGRYTASAYCCEKTFYCIDDKITLCDINHTRGSSATYVMIY